MNLKSLMNDVEVLAMQGDADVDVTGLSINSRKVEKGHIFFAVRGTKMDGNRFIDSAISSGAIGVVSDRMVPEYFDSSIVYIEVEDVVEALGTVASNFYDHPSLRLKLVGVTGTNGKTTIATLLYHLLKDLGFQVGLMSTIENIVCEEVSDAKQTTPDLIDTNRMLHSMVKGGCSYAIMEVSSHAIDQGRIAGLDFDGAVFTNITKDHLDYHKDFKEYIYAKKKFFDRLKPEAFALSNIDDKNGEVMLQNTRAKKHYYSLARIADFHAKIVENTLEGLHLKVESNDVYLRLIGKFNAYNALAVYGVGILLGLDDSAVLATLSNLGSASGRFEIIRNDELDVIAILDYAHTPDALKNVLDTVRNVVSGGAKIITIAGAGGDREKTKRPEMGRIAAELSHIAILTSDNPRSEDPGDIIDEMMKDLGSELEAKVMKIENRKEAIKVAEKLADKGDIILIAGKGHETYQEIDGVKYPFNDKEIIENIWFKD